MKSYILWGIMLFTSLQTQGMDSAKNQDTQMHANDYTSTVQQLRETTEFYIHALQVRGRDYSKLVIDHINKINTLEFQANNYHMMFFTENEKKINDTLSNELTRFIRNDNMNAQYYGKKISQQYLHEKVEEEKKNEIQSLRKHYHQSSELVSQFYKEPNTLLCNRNDTYVWLYFSLRDLKIELEKPFEQNNPQDIKVHFQNVKRCLIDLSEILAEAKEDEMAFHPSWLVFETTIDMMGESADFRYGMLPEVLTSNMLSDFKIIVEDLFHIPEILESAEPSMDVTDD